MAESLHFRWVYHQNPTRPSRFPFLFLPLSLTLVPQLPLPLNRILRPTGPIFLNRGQGIQPVARTLSGQTRTVVRHYHTRSRITSSLDLGEQKVHEYREFGAINGERALLCKVSQDPLEIGRTRLRPLQPEQDLPAVREVLLDGE